MSRRDPQSFPRDDRRVYDAYVAGRQSAAMAVGVRLGLFDTLDERPLTLEELATTLAVKPRPLRSLLSALFAMGLLARTDDRYSLSDDAALYLVRGRPGWLGGLVDLEIEHFLSPAALLDALQRDDPSVYGNEDPWEAHEADPERARRFTAAMHSVSERPAAGLAEVIDFSSVRRLLDVGGGSGALSIALARAWAELRCVIWDLEVVCDLAREYAADAGVGDRVTAETGNMFTSPFPEGYDAILLSQILHDWPPEKGELLVGKAAAALRPGGLLLVHEKLVDDDGRGPLANVLVNLDMLVWTEGQQYDEATLREMFARAGFVDVERRATAGYWSVVLGRRG